MDQLTREQFHEIAGQGGMVPVYRELPADLETPVSVYLKLRGEGVGFLLESVEKAEQIGRYSFLGVGPRRQIRSRGSQVTVEEVARYQPVAPLHHVVAGLPRFYGGAVGYLGYDLVRFIERLPDGAADPLGLPDVHLLLTDTLVVFDHVQHRLLLFANARVPAGTALDAAYDEAVSRLDALEARVRAPLPAVPAPPGRAGSEAQSNMSRAQYEAAVRAAKEYIAAGDIFQTVLSQRLARPTDADPFAIYRALRRINPSPYMFFLELGGDPPVHLVGSSPEVLVRAQDGVAEVRPLAGTRPRGKSEAEDAVLETELLADPKERAEHVMLVDLGRNDLGRVCEYGSVHVPELLATERYSHVMHIVSHVTGQLREGVNAYDLLRATFPAGTVSGAPKVRAMEIIEELEGVRRGPYAGAVGYFGFQGNIDTCIAIRTIVMRGDIAYLQAGAGIVADSDPTREYEETLHKARALGRAIEMAEQGI
jgi:anthranilate synthase component 1